MWLWTGRRNRGHGAEKRGGSPRPHRSPGRPSPTGSPQHPNAHSHENSAYGQFSKSVEQVLIPSNTDNTLFKLKEHLPHDNLH